MQIAELPQEPSAYLFRGLRRLVGVHRVRRNSYGSNKMARFIRPASENGLSVGLVWQSFGENLTNVPSQAGGYENGDDSAGNSGIHHSENC